MMGQTLRICYSDTSYEHLMFQVEENLKINEEMRQRHTGIGASMQRTVNTIDNNMK